MYKHGWDDDGHECVLVPAETWAHLKKEISNLFTYIVAAGRVEVGERVLPSVERYILDLQDENKRLQDRNELLDRVHEELIRNIVDLEVVLTAVDQINVGDYVIQAAIEYIRKLQEENSRC